MGSKSSSGYGGPGRAGDERSRTTSISGRRSGVDLATEIIFSKQIDFELERHLGKLIRAGTVEPQEKKTVAAKLGLKINDIDRWLLLKQFK